VDLGLKGRTAFITGGGGGIGRATGKMLAAEGALVALLDISQDALDSAQAEITEAVPDAKIWTGIVDVGVKDSVNSIFAQAEAELAPCDILVNNAGFARDKYMLKMDESDWDDVHNVVLKGAFHCARAVMPGMMQRNWGRVINMSSMAHLGNKGQTNYSAAKAGLIGFTNALAREAGAFNITANAIAPGLVATPRLKARKDYEKLKQRSLSITPMPRLAEVDDVAKAVTFFASSLGDIISAQMVGVTAGR
jgi:3-oxoacyl-[acyl-carrier protein] reductase